MIGYISMLPLLLQQGSYVPYMRSDSDTHRYIGPDYGLNDALYTPEYLIPIPTSQSLIPTGTMYLRIDALMSLIRMSHDIYDDLRLPLIVISAYRSHAHQQGIIDRHGSDNLRAQAGHSEHQIGLAIDIMGLHKAHMEGNDDASRIYQRLTHNAHNYGRHQSYQYGVETDGYEIEKWHRRYVGTGLSTYLTHQKMTLTQYFYQLIHPINTHNHNTRKPHSFKPQNTSPDTSETENNTDHNLIEAQSLIPKELQ